MQAQPTRKLGIFLWFGYRLPVRDRARLIREAGFETVLHWWDDTFLEIEGLTKEEQADLLRKEGLFIENAHLWIDSANALWLDMLDGQAMLEHYLSDLDGLAAHEIPVAVLHLTSGFEPPSRSAVGMDRVRALVERAERRGVRIALENVRNNRTLVHVLDALDSPMLGMCYDSGHDFIWSETPYDLPRRYRDRLFAVHLHDNLGQYDDHLPPGAGKIDWAVVRRAMADSAYQGSYTLEGDSREIPESRTAREHLRLHYEGARAALLCPGKGGSDESHAK